MSSIGEVSVSSGVQIETIRYYERIGLMPRPARTANQRRRYDGKAVDQLVFIRRARELGFSISEIRTLIGLSSVKRSCADVHALTVGHLDDVRRKIADLRKIERTLKQTAERCARGSSSECPIIDALSHSRNRL